MKTNLIKRVAQKKWEKGDCGIACVAMVAWVKYEVALRAFQKVRGIANPKNYYTFHADIQAMLSQLGIQSQRKRFKQMRKIPGHAIVKVNLRQNNTWHWVVFDAGRQCLVVHDPKPGKNYLITDFRGLKGSGTYILIGRSQE